MFEVILHDCLQLDFNVLLVTLVGKLSSGRFRRGVGAVIISEKHCVRNVKNVAWPKL